MPLCYGQKLNIILHSSQRCGHLIHVNLVSSVHVYIYTVPMAQSTFPLLFLVTKGPEPGMKMKCFQTERRKQLIMALFQQQKIISFCTVVTGLSTLHYIYPCTHPPPPLPPPHTLKMHCTVNTSVIFPQQVGGFLHKTACPSKLLTFS